MDWRQQIESAEDRSAAWLRAQAAEAWRRLRLALAALPWPQPSRTESLEACAALALAAIVVGWVWALAWTPILSALLLSVALLWPQGAHRVAQGWLGLAKVLGMLSGWVLLSVLFGLVLTPLAWLRRWRRRAEPTDAPPFYRSAPRHTTFRPRNHSFGPADFEKPW